MENPIKKNRYVNDITFATRFALFIDYVGKKYGAGDFIINQEFPYFMDVANKLKKYQRETMDADDYDYFANVDKNTVLNN